MALNCIFKCRTYPNTHTGVFTIFFPGNFCINNCPLKVLYLRFISYSIDSIQRSTPTRLDTASTPSSISSSDTCFD